MTRCQSRWVSVVIIGLVVILRLPTLLPSLYNGDEGYYGIIASDTPDGGGSTSRRRIRTPPASIIFTSPFSNWLGRTIFLPFMSSPSLSSQPPPWSYGGLVR